MPQRIITCKLCNRYGLVKAHRRAHIGFVAKHFIKEGEDLFFNYGRFKQSKDFPWAKTDAKEVATKIRVSCK